MSHPNCKSDADAHPFAGQAKLALAPTRRTSNSTDDSNRRVLTPAVDDIPHSMPITEDPEPESMSQASNTGPDATIPFEIRFLADAIALVLVSSIGRLTEDKRSKPPANRRKRQSLKRRSRTRQQYAPNSKMNPRQAAKLLGVSGKTLANWRYLGNGPVYEKAGGRYVRYRFSDLVDFMEAGRRRSTSDLGGGNA